MCTFVLFNIIVWLESTLPRSLYKGLFILGDASLIHCRLPFPLHPFWLSGTTQSIACLKSSCSACASNHEKLGMGHCRTNQVHQYTDTNPCTITILWAWPESGPRDATYTTWAGLVLGCFSWSSASFESFWSVGVATSRKRGDRLLKRRNLKIHLICNYSVSINSKIEQN